MKYKIKRIYILFLVYIITGCHYFHNNSNNLSELGLKGPKKTEVSVFEVTKNTQYIYKGHLTSTNQLKLPPGNYIATNECSTYPFSLSNQPIEIQLNTINIKYFEDSEANIQDPYFTSIVCKNQRNDKEVTFSNTNQIYMLPGKNTLNIGGKKFFLDIPPNKEKRFKIELYPLILNSPLSHDHTQYFIQSKPPQKRNKKPLKKSPLVSNRIDRTLWLPKGDYLLEINGTRYNLSMETNKVTSIHLGAIRVLSPKKFLEESSQFSNSPIFAYLNDKTLLRLNEFYSIIPNIYSISLDKSKLKQTISIQAGETQTMQTFGAEIDPPVCKKDEENDCNIQKKVLIFHENESKAHATALLGKPFLVFKGEYFYSIEGMEDIKKKLRNSENKIIHERIGEIKINWKLKITDKSFETHKIQIEPVCCNIQGISKDINSYKPRMLLLPIGQYRVTSSIKQDKGQLVKRNSFTSILSTHTNNIEIPVFAQSDQNWHVLFDNQSENTDEPTHLTPVAP